MKISRFYLFLFFFLNTLLSAIAQDEVSQKINGISMVASRNSIDMGKAEDLKQLGSDYIAVMPYAFMPENENPKLIFDTKRQWSGETVKGIGTDVRILKSQGLQVMIKPHIWVGNGVFTGDISMLSDKDWKQFEENYRTYILTFARLAEQHRVSLLCIGTELHEFVSQRPEFWCRLIDEVRSIYTGKLTYAENWDKHNNLMLWDSLDFIGIDAYFPISESKTPSLEQVNMVWKDLAKELNSFSKFHNTKILFTEYGYRSIDYAGREPWNSSRNQHPANETAQLNLIKGLHQSLWDEDWFAGGFLWKWFPNYDPNSKRYKNRFTVQGKVSEIYLKSFFSRPTIIEY
ncbi:glycoside hydrolase [Psychroflexus sp. CAK57W]|uniref:glycoside hydrolase family 113 n=1 Tax=Psychroflexus curvus TaxID=2873595 RepID=UPI001CCFE41D|nr:glycoside hydrolase [Psychroflexus curvus]MBZ9786101.1 glycoside hydrolase [Psychroflexus curvus]